MSGAIEIWDVKTEHIASGSAIEVGVTGMSPLYAQITASHTNVLQPVAFVTMIPPFVNPRHLTNESVNAVIYLFK